MLRHQAVFHILFCRHSSEQLVWACYHYHLKKLLSWSHCLSAKASHLSVAHSEKKKGYLYSHSTKGTNQLSETRSTSQIYPKPTRFTTLVPAYFNRWNMFSLQASGTLSVSESESGITTCSEHMWVPPFMAMQWAVWSVLNAHPAAADDLSPDLPASLTLIWCIFMCNLLHAMWTH